MASWPATETKDRGKPPSLDSRETARCRGGHLPRPLAGNTALAGGQRADVSIDEVGVRAAIAALPGPQRQVLAEVYYRDRSVAETARMLQIPPGTVRSRIFYGLRALRRALAAHDAVA